VNRWIRELPPGVPQILGYLAGAAVLGTMAPVNVSLRPVNLGINSTSLIPFVALSLLIASCVIYRRWRTRI
jgi:hypothetical protein